MKKTKVVFDPLLTKKAVLYCRFSCEKQREESIEGQRRECSEYAKRNGITIIDEFDDRAMSATNDDRPGFQKMIRESQSHTFGLVLVWKFDRFSRSRLDSIKYKTILKQNGAKLVSATEQITDGPDGILMESLFDGLNEYYSEELSIKVKRGITENVINGKANGGFKPLGYQIVDHRYKVDPVEGPIVKMIFGLYTTNGLNAAEIAKKLDVEGYKRSNGTKITHNTVERVLGSERYIGVMRSSDAVNPSGFPRLIDDSTFKKAQARLEVRRHKGGAYKADIAYALSGKLFCGKCGAIMVGESSVNRWGKRYAYYHCKNGRAHKCDSVHVKQNILDSLVCQVVLTALKDSDLIQKIISNIYQEQGMEPEELISMKATLQDTNKQISYFMKAIGMGIITDSTKSTLLRLESEKDSLEKSISDMSLTFRKFDKQEIKAAVELLAELPMKTNSQRRQIIAEFVEKVTIESNGEVLIKADLFGIKAEVRAGDSSPDCVRIQTDMVHQLTK